MKVEILESANRGCDEFLKRMPNTTIYHTYRWSEVIKHAFGYKVFYLVAKENQTIRGVLPLAHVRSIIFGNRMISQAHSNYGGPVTDCSEALDALYNRAIELTIETGSKWIEFRNMQPLPYKDLSLNLDKIDMRLRLCADPDELWGSFKKDTKVRKLVRKGQKAGISATSGGLELLDEFYNLYTIRMHQLGSPCYSKNLMRVILEFLPENSRIFVARLGNKTIAVKFIVEFNDLVESCWSATLLEYNNLSPNHSLLWEVMRYYCLKGAKWFYFGRSTIGSGHYRFKRRWDAEQIQLHYQYWVRPGHRFSAVSPNNPKYKRKIEMWKKLPLWVTRLAGPYISRGIP